MAARQVSKGRAFLVLLLVAMAAGMGAIVTFIEHTGITPRALAPYIATRTGGPNPTIVGAGALVARQLTVFDRGHTVPPPLLRMDLGARTNAPLHPATALREILVSDGKGQKDRVAMLPDRVALPLQQHIAKVKAQHDRDLKSGGGAVFLPGALARKYLRGSA